MVLKDFESLFDSLAQHFDQSSSCVPGAATSMSEEGFKIAIPMPGVGSDDVVVEYSGRLVTVSGKSSVEGFAKNYKQRVLIPADYDLDAATASLINGLFVLAVPKKHATVKTIKVTSTDTSDTTSDQ